VRVQDEAAALLDRFLASEEILSYFAATRRAFRLVHIVQLFLLLAFLGRNDGTADPRSLAAAVVDLVVVGARALDLLFGQSGLLALEHGVIIDALEEVGFAGIRDLELRDDLLAEARDSDVHGDLPHALSPRRANLEGLLHRSTGGLRLENLPRQQRIYEVTRLNRVSA